MRTAVLLYLCLMVCSLRVGAQTTTHSFMVSGAVAHRLVVTPSMIDTMQQKDLGDVAISDHAGNVKSVKKNLKGVLLKDLLNNSELFTEQCRKLNEYYLIFEASDHYRVVFSWNEIFNSDVGNSLYIITEMDGIPYTSMEQSMLVASIKDTYTGRRYIKCLKNIIVKKL